LSPGAEGELPPIGPDSEEHIYRGHLIRVRVERWGDSTREVVEHPGACGVVALTSRGEVLLIRQFRESVRAFVLEIPAGVLDVQGEGPAECAAREVLEETGFRVIELVPLGTFHSSPGFTNERFELFFARVEPAAPGERAEEAETGLHVMAMTAQEAGQALGDGSITDAKTALALMLAGDRGLVPGFSRRRP
jgi:ADP-ribose pyrophosphatase